MNIFGLLAVIVASLTLLAIVYLLCKHGIKVYRIFEDITKPKAPVLPTIEESKKTNDIPAAAMDAVIQAANALMGIEELEKENK